MTLTGRNDPELPELLRRWREDQRAFRALAERWIERLAAAEAREQARKERLRRLTFGLLGRS
jgi:anti-sigma factor RsiW